jgi:hypothetical protein
MDNINPNPLTKNEIISYLEEQKNELQNKIELDIGKMYSIHQITTGNTTIIVGIPTHFYVNNIELLVIARKFIKYKMIPTNNYHTISYKLIKNIQPITIKDLPLYINEVTTPVYKHIMAGKPYLDNKGVPLKFLEKDDEEL